MTLPDPKVARLQSSFRQLSQEASVLNNASDEFTRAVSVLDKSIGKLNIGLTVWVRVSEWADEDGSYGRDYIGYAKINGNWGIAVRTTTGAQSQPWEDSEVVWLFSDAPRELRLEVAEKLPELIAALSDATTKAAEKVKAKAVEASTLALAIGNLGDDQEKKNDVVPGWK